MQSRNSSTLLCTDSGFMLRTEHSFLSVSESTMCCPQDRTTNIFISTLNYMSEQPDPPLFCVRYYLYLVILGVMSKLRFPLIHLFCKSKASQFLDANGEHVGLLLAKSCKKPSKPSLNNLLNFFFPCYCLIYTIQK